VLADGTRTTLNGERLQPPPAAAADRAVALPQPATDLGAPRPLAIPAEEMLVPAFPAGKEHPAERTFLISPRYQ